MTDTERPAPIHADELRAVRLWAEGLARVDEDTEGLTKREGGFVRCLVGTVPRLLDEIARQREEIERLKATAADGTGEGTEAAQ